MLSSSFPSRRGGPGGLALSRTGPISIHVQLLDQLRRHIEEGTWNPGAKLPTPLYLAGSLDINTNTVRAVYRDLERDGYVLTRQGRGTFVAPSAPSTRDEYERIYDLMGEVAIYAHHAGVSADELARIAFQRAQIFTPNTASVRVLFAECNRPEADYHAGTIREGTGVVPSSFLIQELRNKKPRFFAGFDVIATTLFHAAELQEIVGPERRVLGLMVEPSFNEVVARLIPLPPRARIAVICSTVARARKYVSALRGVGLTHLTFWTVPLGDKKAVERAFHRADQIYISRLVKTLHKGPWPTDTEVFDYVDCLDSSALRLLRRHIADFATRKIGELGRALA
jgi:DNA-binding transcriptional regulator YhcF (GntR family)